MTVPGGYATRLATAKPRRGGRRGSERERKRAREREGERELSLCRSEALTRDRKLKLVKSVTTAGKPTVTPETASSLSI